MSDQNFEEPSFAMNVESMSSDPVGQASFEVPPAPLSKQGSNKNYSEKQLERMNSQYSTIDCIKRKKRLNRPKHNKEIKIVEVHNPIPSGQRNSASSFPLSTRKKSSFEKIPQAASASDNDLPTFGGVRSAEIPREESKIDKNYEMSYKAQEEDLTVEKEFMNKVGRLEERKPQKNPEKERLSQEKTELVIKNQVLREEVSDWKRKYEELQMKFENLLAENEGNSQKCKVQESTITEQSNKIKHLQNEIESFKNLREQNSTSNPLNHSEITSKSIQTSNPHLISKSTQNSPKSSSSNSSSPYSSFIRPFYSCISSTDPQIQNYIPKDTQHDEK
ncbi:unnamed protein product [Moneuplotes crassus]|uniref:Uncharacterized protein n=1 Tax=Euplotes crassus TaxID=5936 RepID=A0AAD1XL96_EUPCR|nr:unnamed protein product [Moneuplotes crassus]